MFVARNSNLSSNSVRSEYDCAPDGGSELGGSISISRPAALGRAGRYRSRYCNKVKWPFASQLINRPVEDIEIHVVFRAGNGVQASASIPRTAILFTRKLPKRVGFPSALRKVCYRASEPRIPEPRLRKHFIRPESFRDCLGDFVVAVDERIAAGLLSYPFDESARPVKAHVLRPIRAFKIEGNQVISFRLNSFQKEISLFDWITRPSEMISAPFVPTLLRLIPAVTVFAICPIPNCRAMNDRHDPFVGCEVVPIDIVSFVRINGERDVRLLPGLTEFG